MAEGEELWTAIPNWSELEVPKVKGFNSDRSPAVAQQRHHWEIWVSLQQLSELSSYRSVRITSLNAPSTRESLWREDRNCIGMFEFVFLGSLWWRKATVSCEGYEIFHSLVQIIPAFLKFMGICNFRHLALYFIINSSTYYLIAT